MKFFLNGKDYATEYTGDKATKATLAVYSPSVINISSPSMV